MSLAIVLIVVLHRPQECSSDNAKVLFVFAVLSFQAKIPDVGFLKIHAPWEVLCREAEFMKLKMRTKKVCTPPHWTKLDSTEQWLHSVFQPVVSFSANFQKYEVSKGNNGIYAVNSFIQRLSAPLTPKVEEKSPQNEKHICYPFSREKQHLWVKHYNWTDDEAMSL